jgi:hypothetical protein
MIADTRNTDDGVISRLERECYGSTTDFVSVPKHDLIMALRVAGLARFYVNLAHGGIPSDPVARRQYDHKMKETFARLVNNVGALK